jgi:hypothetical protein
MTTLWLVLALAFQQPSPADVVRAALGSLGGETRARAIAGVRLDGAGYATGDGITTFVFSETRDNRQPSLIQDVTVVSRPGLSHHSVRTLHAGDRGMDTWFTEAPENVLLAALAAPDLVADSGATVRFTWHGRPVRVHCAAPFSVELNGATTTWSRWHDGYPREWDVTRAGATVEAFTADSVTITRH